MSLIHICEQLSDNCITLCVHILSYVLSVHLCSLTMTPTRVGPGSTTWVGCCPADWSYMHNAKKTQILSHGTWSRDSGERPGPLILRPRIDVCIMNQACYISPWYTVVKSQESHSFNYLFIHPDIYWTFVMLENIQVLFPPKLTV